MEPGRERKLKVITYRVIVEDEGDAVNNVDDLILDTLCFALEGVQFITDGVRDATKEEAEYFEKEELMDEDEDD